MTLGAAAIESLTFNTRMKVVLVGSPFRSDDPHADPQTGQFLMVGRKSLILKSRRVDLNPGPADYESRATGLLESARLLETLYLQLLALDSVRSSMSRFAST